MSIADGGSDFDSITFAGNVGNIDFSQVDDGIIKNIELLDFTMGANANIINLNYNDVINMTDSDNRLFIATDNSDTINFNNTSGNIFVESNDTVNVDGNSYNTFTDGNITVLIDVEANVTGL